MSMKTSSRGIDLIARFEGFPGQQPYNDPTGFCTVGYGHLLHRSRCTDADVRRWRGISHARAKALLAEDVRRFERAVNRLVRVLLTQNQFDALVSFCFNVGEGAFASSTLLRKLNARDYAGARREFARWNRGGGRVLAGLTRRRASEAALFGSAEPAGDPLEVLTRGERRAVLAHRKSVERGWHGREAYWHRKLTEQMLELRRLGALEHRENNRYARYLALREERARHKPTPRPKGDAVVHRSFKSGSRGPDVLELQRAINRELKARHLGHYAIGEDGVVGPKTLKAAYKAAWALGLPRRGLRALAKGEVAPSAQRRVRDPEERPEGEVAAGDKRIAAYLEAAHERAKRKPKALDSWLDSPYWRLEEFHCRDGTPVPKRAIPALRVHVRKVLDPCRRKFGRGTCNSGYRHRRYNARIGGASQSFHIYDIHPDAPATDVWFAKGSPAAWADEGSHRMNGGGGVGTYRSFVHFDRRSRRSRWRG